MDRNFFRRIEICFPVLEPRLKKRVIREGLNAYLGRDIEAWEMDANGQYRFRKGKRGRSGHAQTVLLDILVAKTGS
jgi:polyphosphate kinase